MLIHGPFGVFLLFFLYCITLPSYYLCLFRIILVYLIIFIYPFEMLFIHPFEKMTPPVGFKKDLSLFFSGAYCNVCNQYQHFNLSLKQLEKEFVKLYRSHSHSYIVLYYICSLHVMFVKTYM